MSIPDTITKVEITLRLGGVRNYIAWVLKHAKPSKHLPKRELIYHHTTTHSKIQSSQFIKLTI